MLLFRYVPEGFCVSRGCTPAGVGPLAEGDTVEVEVPGVVVLRNPMTRWGR